MTRMQRIIHRPVTRIAAAALFSGVHVAALFAATFPVGTVAWLFPLAYILPGLLTMILIPGAWRKWYRWLVLVFLTFAVSPDLLAVVLFTGQAWALYRSWFLERTRPLKELFGPRAPKPAKASGGRQTPKATPPAGPVTISEAMMADKAASADGAGPAKITKNRKTDTRNAKASAKNRKADTQAAKTASVRKPV